MRSATLAGAVVLGIFAVGCAQQEAAAPAQKEAAKPVVEAPAAPAPEIAPALPAPAPTAKAPAIRPAEPGRIAALVAQLGDKDYATREGATKELAALGKAAESALEAALKSPDVETATRAKDLLTRLKGSAEEAGAPEIPGLAEAVRANRGGAQIMVQGVGGAAGVGARVVVQAQGQAGGGVQTTETVSGGNRTRTVTTAGGSAAIAEGENGFSLTLTPKGGEAKTFSAASREEFKKKYPNLYAKYFGD